MAGRGQDQAGGGGQGREAQQHQGGYQGAGPGFGRGYGRDFGGGRDQGFDGSSGQGYDASAAPSDYREGSGGEAYGGGMSAADYQPSAGGREQDLRESDVWADDRSWIDRCADDEIQGRRRYRGRGPKHWTRDDQRVYEEVCERLLHDRLIDARGIEVEVDNGVVTLKGEARAPADPLLAERLVRETPGVRGVELELVVKPAPHADHRQDHQDEWVDKSSLLYPILPT